MKWVKHFTDNHRGRSMQALFDELKHTGPYCYYILLEICAEKLEKKPNQMLNERDCLFTFRCTSLQRTLRISASKLQRLLHVCATNELFCYEIVSKEVIINMPILLNLLDRDSKKPRSERVSTAPEPRLEEDKIREDKIREEKEFSSNSVSGDGDKPNSSKKQLTAEQKDLNKRIWESYKDAYFIRWKQEPLRNATVNGQISMLRSRLGEDAVRVISFYVMSNNSFYVGKCHPIGLCLNDAEGLRTQMLNGKAITSTMIRTFEKQNQMQETFNEIDEHYENQKKEEKQ